MTSACVRGCGPADQSADRAPRASLGVNAALDAVCSTLSACDRAPARLRLRAARVSADPRGCRQAVTALRSTLILGSLLNTLDADELHKAMQVEEGDASLWKILKGLTTKEARQVAIVGVNLMNVIGKALLKRRALEKPLFSP